MAVEANPSPPSVRTPASARTTRRPRTVRLLVLGLVVAVLAIDQGSKQWAVSELSGDRSRSVLGDALRLRLLYNPGAAFSMGTELTWVFTLIAFGAVLALATFAWRTRSRRWGFGLGLALGGASSHLLDRLFRSPGIGRGHVVDFIDYGGFFVGNIADIAIVSGMALLVVMNLFGVPVDPKPGRSDPTKAKAKPNGKARANAKSTTKGSTPANGTEQLDDDPIAPFLRP